MVWDGSNGMNSAMSCKIRADRGLGFDVSFVDHRHHGADHRLVRTLTSIGPAWSPGATVWV